MALVKFLKDVYPHCKGDIVKLDEKAIADAKSFVTRHKLVNAFEVLGQDVVKAGEKAAEEVKARLETKKAAVEAAKEGVPPVAPAKK